MTNFLYHKRKMGGVEVFNTDLDFSRLSIYDLVENRKCEKFYSFNGPLQRKDDRCSDKNYNFLNLLEAQDKTRSCRKACFIRRLKHRCNSKFDVSSFSIESDCNSILIGKKTNFIEIDDESNSLTKMFACIEPVVAIKLSMDQNQAVFSYFYFKCLLEYTMYRLFKAFFMCSFHTIDICEEDRSFYDSKFSQFNTCYDSSSIRMIDIMHESWILQLIHESTINLNERNASLLAIGSSNFNDEKEYDGYLEDSNLMDID